MSAKRIDLLIWAAIYAGMILLGLGLAVRRTAGEDSALGWVLLGVGGVLVAAGVGLIGWRSRVKAGSG